MKTPSTTIPALLALLLLTACTTSGSGTGNSGYRQGQRDHNGVPTIDGEPIRYGDMLDHRSAPEASPDQR